MKRFQLLSIFCFLTMLSASSAFAQSTFSRVSQILQSNCTSSGCHGSDNTQLFDVSGSQTDLYNAIVNVAPTNATAASKNHKLVAPGYPTRSFLLRKIINGLGPELTLETSEGDACPKNLPALSNVEIELVRQWIMFGAPQTGKVVEEQVLVDYYDNHKGLAEIQAPPAPPEGQGFQIHDGPIFLAPGEEKEFQWKYDTELPNAMEVNRVQAHLSDQSHHYIVYKYNEGYKTNVPEGHRLVDNISAQADVQFNASMIATWQYDRDHALPAGTAYFWEPGAAMCSNFHVRNYDGDSILAAHAYLNVYTQPAGSGAVEMFSQLAVYGGFNPFNLNVPNTGTNTVLSFDQVRQETWNIWIMQAHTHKYGRDYDIFLRNGDGTQGTQLYEGYYNYEDGFNMGYYDYAHPPVLAFEPMLQVDMRNGLTHTATFNNNGPNDVGFGLTTADEMFITYMHYTKETPTAVRSVQENSIALNVYPNPANGQFTIQYAMPETGNLKMEVFNLLGESMGVLKNETVTKGSYSERMNTNHLSQGVYFIRLSSANFSGTSKLVIE